MYHALVASAFLHVPCHMLLERWRAGLARTVLTSQSDHLSFWLQCVPYEWVCDLHSPLPVLGPTLPQSQNTVKTSVQVTVTAELEAGPSLGPDPDPGPVHFPSCDLCSALHAATHQLVSWPVLTCGVVWPVSEHGGGLSAVRPCRGTEKMCPTFNYFPRSCGYNMCTNLVQPSRPTSRRRRAATRGTQHRTGVY